MSDLEQYLPKNAINHVNKWLANHPVKIIIKTARKRKLGDYLAPHNQSIPHQITINHNLPPYPFFLVLTHEIAHLLVHANHPKVRQKPHGKEWKQMFGQLLLESINIYPTQHQTTIIQHANHPKANVFSDPNLYLLYFNPQDHQILVKDLELGTKFYVGKQQFIKMEERKIRYICKNLTNNKTYSIHGLAKVDKIIEQ